jgi:hypothetical protein
LFGPIVVSLIAVSLPVVAGTWLAPRRDGNGCNMRLKPESRTCRQSLVITVQDRIEMKHLPAAWKPLRRSVRAEGFRTIRRFSEDLAR